MGWKSTINITRDEAVKAIVEQMVTLNDKTNKELEDMLEDYGFGDDSKLKWYGHNFIVDDE
jgi:hypothetical protein